SSPRLSQRSRSASILILLWPPTLTPRSSEIITVMVRTSISRQRAVALPVEWGEREVRRGLLNGPFRRRETGWQTLLGFRRVPGAFLLLVFLPFVGRRIALEALGDLLVGLLPLLVGIGDLANQVEPPGQTLRLRINQINDQSAFLLTAGADAFKEETPVAANIRAVGAPVASDSDIQLRGTARPVPQSVSIRWNDHASPGVAELSWIFLRWKPLPHGAGFHGNYKLLS